MRTIHHTLLLFAVIVIEGYVVLSSELLAIRQTLPYVGSGTDTISIIIAAVLMPLAFGYQRGGRFKPHTILRHHISVRQKLILNILISATILFFGLSHITIGIFFENLNEWGLRDRILLTTLYCLLFLVVPVYLLGQTVPLISNFFSKERLSKITGKILFFSTVGSFLGAVFSTLVLMAVIGVHHTASLNLVLLAVLVIMLSRKKLSKSVCYTLIIAVLALLINSDYVMHGLHIRENNEYNTVQTFVTPNGARLFKINNNMSSGITPDGKNFVNIEYVEDLLIEPILSAHPPKNILVLGAGGFTFGKHDSNNNYTFVDIDDDLKDVAEKYLHKEKLGDNKKFVAQPARAYLRNTDKKYDLIYLDMFQAGAMMPEHTVTREFFLQVKNALKDGGILATNTVVSPSFDSALSRNFDNTFRSVFPHVSRHVIDDRYNLWGTEDQPVANVSYIYRHEKDYERGHIYTDNKNTVFYDKPRRKNLLKKTEE